MPQLVSDVVGREVRTIEGLHPTGDEFSGDAPLPRVVSDRLGPLTAHHLHAQVLVFGPP
jgi:hypothetical protein